MLLRLGCTSPLAACLGLPAAWHAVPQKEGLSCRPRDAKA
jgi:hypothetical protein